MEFEAKFKERAISYIYSAILRKIKSLIMFRGTFEEITSELQEIALRDGVCLKPFEEPLEGLDYGFNINLGKINNTYFDFEIYLLKTNEGDIYLITEINRF